MARRIRILVILAVLAATLGASSGAHALPGCNFATPQGTTGAMCTVGQPVNCNSSDPAPLFIACHEVIEPLLEGFHGAEIGQLGWALNPYCYSSGVGVCYRKAGVYSALLPSIGGINIRTSCIGAGFHGGDQINVTAAGTAFILDVGDKKLYPFSAPAC